MRCHSIPPTPSWRPKMPQPMDETFPMDWDVEDLDPQAPEPEDEPAPDVILH